MKSQTFAYESVFPFSPPQHLQLTRHDVEPNQKTNSYVIFITIPCNVCSISPKGFFLVNWSVFNLFLIRKLNRYDLLTTL